MRRWSLCMLVALTLAGAVAPLLAQSTLARLGVMADVSRGSPAHANLMRGLAERGWVEGHNLVVEYVQLNEDAKQSEQVARRLAQLKCDVILTQGTAATLAAQSGAPQTPRVFALAIDPIALGIVATLQRPGGNATGFAAPSNELAVRQLSLLRELAPAAQHIALMFQAGNDSLLLTAQSIEVAAGPLGVVVRRFPLRDGYDVDAAHLALTRQPVGGLLVLFDRVTYGHRGDIVAMANRLRLPTVYGSRYFAEQGGFVSFGIDWPALMVGTADHVARILGGARPADLPVQQPMRFELVINRRSARTLGVTIPDALLLQATEVIE